MGEHDVHGARDAQSMRAFTQSLLEDLRALERMIELDQIERGVRRVGVEQEMFVVDAAGRPAPRALEVLDALGDPRFTTEIALFNLEANIDPRPLEGDFLRAMEGDVNAIVARACEAAARVGCRVLLTGILPTLTRSDLRAKNLTPSPRYVELEAALKAQRGDDFAISIHGVDELDLRADSVVFESANTSIQLHLQVEPGEFAAMYNLAQLVTAPLLAAAVNSPLLLGRRLWHETRIALFERAVDGRSDIERARGLPGRVRFGDAWVSSSVLELFREDAARFRVLLTRAAEPDPMRMVERGEAPKLAALTLHNGTTWRSNRPCYGVLGGKPHLRIENRVLPSGPTVLDEVANAALFYGMMLRLGDAYGDVSRRLSFDRARENFISAARQGLDAQLTWLGGTRVSARDLILGELVPAAREGLTAVGAPSEDIDRYLGTLEARVSTGRTGARWTLDAFDALSAEGTREAAEAAIAASMLRAQASGEPVHRWAPAEPALASGLEGAAVRAIMSTDLFTVRPDDVVDLATSVMAWRHVRHVPVEDTHGQLVGLVSHRALLRLNAASSADKPADVASIMDPAPATVAPDTPLIEAMRHLLDSEAGCLLVVSNGRLEGIVTERDFVRAAATLLSHAR